jgi:NAD(P)-dependent dehydrogenase (short-subunit alcohol dehydrogenase family)
MGKIAEEHILITGGNSGIGLATAQEFDREGALVAICGLNEDSREYLEPEPEGYGDVRSFRGSRAGGCGEGCPQHQQSKQADGSRKSRSRRSISLRTIPRMSSGRIS